MRKCALLVVLSVAPLVNAFAQTPFPTIANGTLVVNGVYQNNVTPAVAHNYKIATLPANNSSGHDFLRILVTLNPSYLATKDSYIDATFANRGGFTYQYLLLGADVTTTTTLAAYQNSDSSVDIYIVFSGAQQYTMAGYTMIQNEQETVYTTPPDAPPTGTKVFDASQSVRQNPKAVPVGTGVIWQLRSSEGKARRSQNAEEAAHGRGDHFCAQAI